MKTIRFLGLAILGSLPISLSATVLGDLAAAMPARTFVKVPANASLAALNISSTLYAWNNSAVWDPVHKMIRQVGSGGTCCSNGQYFMTTYHDSSNLWTVDTAPFQSPGHAYDGNTINPATGFHYFGKYQDKVVRTWDGATWGALPQIPFAAATTPAMAWFPELNGGKGAPIFLGASGQLAWYDHDSLKWHSLPTLTGLGTYNTFAEYNPVHKLLWMGAGNGGETVHYKMDAQFNTTRLTDAPFSLNNHQAVQSAEPVSGKYIVLNMIAKTWWEFDIVTDTWTQITNATGPRPFPPSNSSVYMFQVPISDYGVILYLQHYYTSRDVYLYKHAQPSSIQTAAAQSRDAESIQVSPNPIRGTATLWLMGSPNPTPLTWHIYDARGRRVAVFVSLGTQIQWNAANVAPGIYQVRTTGKGIVLKSSMVVLK